MAIGRLILALLLLCVALPATAAMPCHDGDAMPAAMTMPHDTPATQDHRDTTLAAHICIGCVPPSSWRSAVVAEAPIASTLAPMAQLTSPRLGERLKPSTPPPRFG